LHECFEVLGISICRFTSANSHLLLFLLLWPQGASALEG
jgi:hypothetical protein